MSKDQESIKKGIFIKIFTYYFRSLLVMLETKIKDI